MKKLHMSKIVCAVLWMLLSIAPAATAQLIDIYKTDTAPVIDGILDESLWEDATGFDSFVTYKPILGQQPSQKTLVYICYDSNFLYVAFKCFDTQPEQIRANLVDRDKTGEEDWAAIALDVDNEESSGIFFVLTARGVQTDGTLNAEYDSDISLDMKWTGETHIDEFGYTVEMALPFSSIHPPSEGINVFGFHATRYISRFSEQPITPIYDPQKGAYISQFIKIRVNAIATSATVEILPEFTYQNDTDSSQTPRERTQRNNTGLSFRFGSNGSQMGAVTWRPDFSHIESDASQVEANLRNALYYTEKRPFFLEGKEDFSIAAADNSSPLREVVHTRSIVQPEIGMRYSGKVGSHQRFSILYARDDYRNGGTIPDASEIGIIRYQYRMNGSSYIGAAATLRTTNGDYNTVTGIDGRIRPYPGLRIEYHGFLSATDNRNNQAKQSGYSAAMTAAYRTERLELSGGIQSVSRDFNTEVGYLDRRGITQFPVYAAYTIPFSWGPFVSIVPNVYSLGKTDLPSGLFEKRNTLNLRANLTRDGYIEITRRFADEAYKDRLFNNNGYGINSQLRIISSLKLNLNAHTWHGPYYDADNPFQGKTRDLTAGGELRIGSHFGYGLNYQYQYMKREYDGSKVYTYNVVRSGILYQFNRRWNCRSIFEYNRFRKSFTIDYIISYTPSPGSVLYFGYGSDYSDVNNISFYNGNEQERRLFLKLSYLGRYYR